MRWVEILALCILMFVIACGGGDGDAEECAVDLDCNDGNSCTTDQCVAGVCGHKSTVAMECDDGDLCTEGSTCTEEATCEGGTPITYDDIPCTVCACTPDKGVKCEPKTMGTPCNDNDCCTSNDFCDVCQPDDPDCGEYGMQCVGDAKDCSDEKECTQDVCSCEEGEPFCGNPDQPDGFPCVEDENACTEGDFCQGGQCLKGAPLNLDDENPCTQDYCEKGEVVNSPILDAQCDDGNECTEDDYCYLGTCTGGEPIICEGIPCSASVECKQGEGCVYSWKPEGAECDDGDLCSLTEICNEEHACVGQTFNDCDDFDACTSDACDPNTGGCNNTIVEGVCDDGDPCTSTDICDPSGECLGTPIVCADDGNPCTDDICNVGDGSCGVSLDDGLPCADDELCNGDETCLFGMCTPGTAIVCEDDGDPCTLDSCDSDTGTCHTDSPDDTPCDDDDLCNGYEICVSGACEAGTVVDCSDVTELCLEKTCNPATGLCDLNMADDTPCDDDNLCNGNEICVSGACEAGTAVDCSDVTELCLANTCNPTTGLCDLYMADHTPCNDDDLCNGQETCQGGSCTLGTPVDCPLPDTLCSVSYCDDAEGICVTDITPDCCGNTIVETDETCDDGNLDSGDGCTADCVAETCIAFLFGPTCSVTEAKFTPTIGVANTNDSFKNVAIDGDTMVVGAPADDTLGGNSGAVFVHMRSGGTWVQQQKLTADDTAAGDLFGWSVSISGDTIAIGAWADDDLGTQSGSAYVFTRVGGEWTQSQKLTASDGTVGAHFGKTVSIRGDYIAVGSPWHDALASNSGAGYVFHRLDDVWSEQQKLLPSVAEIDSYFGDAVSIDDDTIVVGADDNDFGDDSGAAYVFTRTGTLWTEQQRLILNSGQLRDYFGSSVSVFGDTLVVGAQRQDDAAFDAGSAYVYTRSGNEWTLAQSLNAGPGGPHSDIFGTSVAIRGDVLVVGAPWDDDTETNAGAVFVYARVDGSDWDLQRKYGASDAAVDDMFGDVVATDGATVVVGATKGDGDAVDSGAVYVYADCLFCNLCGNSTIEGLETCDDGNTVDGDGCSSDCAEETCVVAGSAPGCTVNESQITPSDPDGDWPYFGNSLAISGDTLVAGNETDDELDTDSGAAYVFMRSGEVWTEQVKLTASDGASQDRFGKTVTISGDTVVVGSPHDDDNAPGSGSAYVFVRDGGVWTQQQKLTASDAETNDNFANSLAISGDTLVVGAHWEDSLGWDSGAVYVFVRSDGVWTEQQKLTASDGGEGSGGNRFGSSIAIDGDTVVVGSRGNDALGSDSGAAYVFERSDGVWTEQQKLTASDGEGDDWFSSGLGISGDTIVVGAMWEDNWDFNSGAAYVFERSDGVWTEQQKLTASNTGENQTHYHFGLSVTLHGNILSLGVPGYDYPGMFGSTAGIGAVYVFVRNAGAWIEQPKLTVNAYVAGDELGNVVSISDSTVVANSTRDGGTVYVFDICPQCSL